MTVALAVALACVAIALCVMQRSEIAYLRGLLAQKHEHQRRIERADAGLPELQPEIQKPDICPPGLQVRLDEAIGAWDSTATQNQKHHDVGQWRREGRSWEWIVDELESEILDG